tara:strand:+ start:228 stop:887 length:660 start_codon:yes stop_codon:yes gene_type:complete
VLVLDLGPAGYRSSFLQPQESEQLFDSRRSCCWRKKLALFSCEKKIKKIKKGVDKCSNDCYIRIITNNRKGYVMKKDYLEKTSIADGTEVRMFRNLRSYTNSIQMNIPNCEGKKRWITVGYIDMARLDDAQFIVHEKTRQKVVAENKKYVHAFVKGKWRSSWTLCGDHDQVEYNPKENKLFKVTDWYGGKEISPDWRGVVYFGKEESTDGTLTLWKERG